MKRFMVFAGQTYYANGGWKDFHCDYNSRDEAIAEVDRLVSEHPRRVIRALADWAHAVDGETGERIHDIGNGGY